MAILDPAVAGPIIGVDPTNPRLAVVCEAADELIYAYLELAEPMVAPAAVLEAATAVAAHLWHLPDLPSGGTAGSSEGGTLDLSADVFAHVRALLWPWRKSVGIV